MCYRGSGHLGCVLGQAVVCVIMPRGVSVNHAVLCGTVMYFCMPCWQHMKPVLDGTAEHYSMLTIELTSRGVCWVCAYFLSKTALHAGWWMLCFAWFCLLVQQGGLLIVFVGLITCVVWAFKKFCVVFGVCCCALLDLVSLPCRTCPCCNSRGLY